MNITAIRIGRTFNTGNYSSKKVEIEAIPDNGQSFEEALAQVTAIVDAQNPQADETENPIKPANKSPAAKPAGETAPPLAGKGKTGPDPTSGNGAATATASKPPNLTTPPGKPPTSTISPFDPPFEPGSDIANEPVAKSRKRGRPKKPNTEPAKLLKGMEKFTTVQEIANRFEAMRVLADRTSGEGWNSWEAIRQQVADHAKSIPDFTTQPGYQQLDLAMKAEKQAGVVAEAGAV